MSQNDFKCLRFFFAKELTKIILYAALKVEDNFLAQSPDQV